jgi:hypothetical protein
MEYVNNIAGFRIYACKTREGFVAYQGFPLSDSAKNLSALYDYISHLKLPPPFPGAGGLHTIRGRTEITLNIQDTGKIVSLLG